MIDMLMYSPATMGAVIAAQRGMGHGGGGTMSGLDPILLVLGIIVGAVVLLAAISGILVVIDRVNKK